METKNLLNKLKKTVTKKIAPYVLLVGGLASLVGCQSISKTDIFEKDYTNVAISSEITSNENPQKYNENEIWTANENDYWSDIVKNGNKQVELQINSAKDYKKYKGITYSDYSSDLLYGLVDMYIFKDTGKTLKEGDEKFTQDSYLKWSPMTKVPEFLDEYKLSLTDAFDKTSIDVDKRKKILNYEPYFVNSIEDGNRLFEINNFGDYLSRVLNDCKGSDNEVSYKELEKKFNKTAYSLNK